MTSLTTQPPPKDLKVKVLRRKFTNEKRDRDDGIGKEGKDGKSGVGKGREGRVGKDGKGKARKSGRNETHHDVKGKRNPE